MEHTADSSDEKLIIEWLNNAALSQDASEKLTYFHKIQEVLIHKNPHLLPKFLTNVFNFTTDRNSEVRKALVGFIEELCKTRDTYMPKVMTYLRMLLNDEAIVVQKRVIQATIMIYRKMLSWLCYASNVTEDMAEAWNELTAIKHDIAKMIDSDNDGIRTSAVKFLECVIILQTYPDEVENRKPNDFSLDNVPLTLKIARRRKLEEEASNFFESLLKFYSSAHISSANLLTCLGILTNLAKNRAEFMPKIVTALHSLYNNLPPTLSTTQVNSVRKKLKTELCSLIRHPAAYEFLDSLTPMLLELGFNQQDINKLVPKTEERRKYCKRTLSIDSYQHPAKRSRVEVVDDNDDISNALTPDELNEQYILDHLNLEKAVDIVIATLSSKLPSTIPPVFSKEYGVYVKNENIGNITEIASLLAKQFTENSLGPGGQKLKETKVDTNKKREREPEEEKSEPEKKKERIKVPRIKTLKLSEITKPLEKEVKENLLLGAVKRLLACDFVTSKVLHQKVVTTLASCFCSSVKETILTYLLSDLRSCIDIALAWLFEEYSIMQGFSRKPPLRKDIKLDQCYNTLLTSLVAAATNDNLILSRLLLEAPLVTDEALEQVKVICRDEKRCTATLGLLHDLAIRKPPKQLTFLNVLLIFTTFENNIIRDCALNYVIDLHKRADLKIIIEEFARMNTEFLKLQRPPESLCGFNQGRMKSETWTDDFIKACLLPFVSLLPSDPSLIHDLAQVYIQTSADIKRVILRLLESPIRQMGMNCPELLKLVETCPKGSETLVTRIIHILTDKDPPSVQLVQIVRDLYNSRVSDVRFLIPVLNGLTKKEIIAALPKLIKLNPVVVKEVFNRLLGLHGESPIAPAELLVALHTIDSSKCDLKTVIKATSLCVQEKQIYTQEVLAVVLQQLMEQTPLPTLLMRTVIQALGSYPRLSGFVMNILQRLIIKQVWKQKVVWEGFIKCCQRTKPQSFAVLIQLPAPQLSEALTMCPELREPLREHLKSFTEGQLAQLPAAIQDVILGSYERQPPPAGVQPITIPVDSNIKMPPPPVEIKTEPLPPGME